MHTTGGSYKRQPQSRQSQQVFQQQAEQQVPHHNFADLGYILDYSPLSDDARPLPITHNTQPIYAGGPSSEESRQYHIASHPSSSNHGAAAASGSFATMHDYAHANISPGSFSLLADQSQSNDLSAQARHHHVVPAPQHSASLSGTNPIPVPKAIQDSTGNGSAPLLVGSPAFAPNLQAQFVQGRSWHPSQSGVGHSMGASNDPNNLSVAPTMESIQGNMQQWSNLVNHQQPTFIFSHSGMEQQLQYALQEQLPSPPSFYPHSDGSTIIPGIGNPSLNQAIMQQTAAFNNTVAQEQANHQMILAPRAPVHGLRDPFTGFPQFDGMNGMQGVDWLVQYLQGAHLPNHHAESSLDLTMWDRNRQTFSDGNSIPPSPAVVQHQHQQPPPVNLEAIMHSRLIKGDLQTAVIPSSVQVNPQPKPQEFRREQQSLETVLSYNLAERPAQQPKSLLTQSLQGPHRSIPTRRLEMRNRTPYTYPSPIGTSPYLSTSQNSLGSTSLPNQSPSFNSAFHRRTHGRHNSEASPWNYPATPSSYGHSRYNSVSNPFNPIIVTPPEIVEEESSLSNSLHLQIPQPESTEIQVDEVADDCVNEMFDLEIPKCPPIPRVSTLSPQSSHPTGQHHGKISVNRELLSHSFLFNSPTDQRRRVILDGILQANWYNDHTHEPDIYGTDDEPIVGGGLLSGVGPCLHPSLQGGEELGEKGKSIYRVFLKHADRPQTDPDKAPEKEYLCMFGAVRGVGGSGKLFCKHSVPGKGYSKPERAIEHVRSHLGHRPHWCEGICGVNPNCPWRFFAKGHLEDHRKKPHKKVK